MSTKLAVSTDPRISELLDHQFVTGRALPLPIDVILQFEDQGCIVDLTTGDILASEALWLAHVVALAGEVTP